MLIITHIEHLFQDRNPFNEFTLTDSQQVKKSLLLAQCCRRGTFFLFLFILLEESCSTMLRQFLLQNKVNQLYVYTYPLFLDSLPTKSAQSIEYNAMCYTIGSYQSSILYTKYIHINPNLPIHSSPRGGNAPLGICTFVLSICVLAEEELEAQGGDSRINSLMSRRESDMIEIISFSHTYIRGEAGLQQDWVTEKSQTL